MRKMGVVMGILGTLLLAAPAFAELYVVGPATLGHPADDPSVGYSSLVLDEAFVSPGAPVALAPGGAGEPLGLWEEAGDQMHPIPGV